MSSGGDPNGNEAPNVIRMRVENVKNLTWKNKVTSEIRRLNGFPWKFSVYDLEGDICCEIECPMKSEVFESEAKVEVKLIDHTDYSRSLREEEHLYFGFLYGVGFQIITIGTCQDIIDDERFVIDGSIVVEAKITVIGGHGDRFRISHRPKPDFFSPSKFSDVILSVEGTKLHVSKQILARASPYFEALFFGDFKESQQSEIALADVSAEEFLDALEIIYNNELSERECNFPDDIMERAEYLLKIADRFDFPRVMSRVEYWLICMEEPYEEEEPPSPIALLLSDCYNLYTLQGLSLRRICDKEVALGIMDSDAYEQFSSGLKEEITKRLDDVTDHSGRRENPDEFVSDVIRLRVENVKKLKWVKSETRLGGFYGAKSEVKWIKGFPWQLKLEVHDGSTSVELVRVKSEIFPWWHCFVEGTIRVINHNDDSASISKDFSDEFCSRKFDPDYCEIERVVEWDDIIDNEDFVVDGSIVIEAEIKIKGRHGDKFRKDLLTDFYSRSKFSDVMFLVEGQKLYASTQILAYASPYFETLFHSDSEGSEEREIVLEDLSLEGMHEALEMIYDPDRSINYNIMESLLKVADRFEITAILDEAEKYLIHPSKLPLHIKLRLSDQYKLELLKIRCLRRIRYSKTLDRLIKSDSYNHYSSDLMDQLFNSVLLRILRMRRFSYPEKNDD